MFPALLFYCHTSGRSGDKTKFFGQHSFMIKRFPYKSMLAAVALALLGFFFYPSFEIARLWYDVIGVDVSHHQGSIDWQKLKRDGISFAYIKATEGGDFVDPLFKINWDASLSADMATGAYHFFTQCKSGSEQAANFIKSVPLDQRSLPPVLDAEQLDCKGNPSSFDTVNEINSFLNVVETHFGCRPIIYTTPDFETAFLQGKLTNETYWPRSIFWPPGYRKESWKFWQYHFAGRRDGVEGPVDLDAFRGSSAEFDKFRQDAKCGATKLP